MESGTFREKWTRVIERLRRNWGQVSQDEIKPPEEGLSDRLNKLEGRLDAPVDRGPEDSRGRDRVRELKDLL